MAFIWLRSREAFQWREFLLIIEANKIGDKVHCTASKVHETWLKLSFDFYYYVNVQELNHTCESRRYKANKMA